ncbi:hypothetical protein IWW50_005385 [Coemansia erecta]|nr:hypothetical protein IWW50_005385 [Coemansia erecta]
MVRVGPEKVGVGEVSMFRKVMGSHDMTKSQMYTDFSLLGENIFTTRNPEFNKARRRQLGPAFASSYVRKMEPLIKDEGIERVCRLFDTQISAAKDKSSGRAETNLYFAFTMMATDIISSLAYGRRFGCVDSLIGQAEAPLGLSQQNTPRQSQENSDTPLQCKENSAASKCKQVVDVEEQESAQTILEYMIGTMTLMVLMAEAPIISSFPPRLLPQALRKLYTLCDKFVSFTHASITRYRKKMSMHTNSPAGGPRNDILSAYIKAQDPKTGATLSDYEIASEATVLLAAGTDTSANVMVNCVRLLVLHPDKYARLQAELRSAFPGGAETITYTEAIEKLPYLIAVIYETMRLRGSSSGVWPRDSPRHSGVTLGEYYIPPGTVICGSIGGVHLNPDTWSMPKMFVPERFLGKDGEQRKRNVVAFSSGVRICPGRHLAMMELVIALSTVLLKYNLAMASNMAKPKADDDYFAEIDEVCHITTSFRHPERDCNFLISHSKF